MKIQKTLGLLLMIIGGPSFGQTDCKEIKSDFAFFDSSKNAWKEDEKIQILDCKTAYKIALIDVKSGKELSAQEVRMPKPEQKWEFDGLSCSLASDKKGGIGLNKAILTSSVEGDQALKPKEVWAANVKSKKIEQIKSKVTCHQDEP